MEKDFLIELFNSSKSIAEICISLYGKKNGGMHNRVLKLFKEIGYDWDKHLRDLETLKKVYCLNCGKEITKKYRSNRKFCSSSCAAQYNNRLREHSEKTKSAISNGLKKYHSEHILTNEEKWENYKKHYNPNISFEEYLKLSKNYRKYKGLKKYKSEKELFCIVCNKKLNGYKTTFCSNECRKKYEEHQYNEYIERWKRGEESGCTPSYKIHKYVKRYLLEKNSNSCQECGWDKVNKYTGNVPLQIHHIDGDCTNNSLDNIQLLCPNCHSLTENFGSRNKNSKRIFRKQKLFKQEIIK